MRFVPFRVLLVTTLVALLPSAQSLQALQSPSIAEKDFVTEAHPGITIHLPGDVPMELVRIPAGSATLGRSPGEAESNSDEDVGTFTFLQDYYMGKFEVTQRQWFALMGYWPEDWEPTAEFGLGDTYPVYGVSWFDAQDFVSALNAHIQANQPNTGSAFLPSEYQWEYACRAGTSTRYSFGDGEVLGENCDGDSEFDKYMWYCGNYASGGTKPVGSKLPNHLGLHDMHGNVEEWCNNYYSEGIPVKRGGYYNSFAFRCRSAYRFSFHGSGNRASTQGFRVVVFPPNAPPGDHALSFDGGDDRVRLDEVALNGLSDFTIEAWFSASSGSARSHWLLSAARSNTPDDDNELLIGWDSATNRIYVYLRGEFQHFPATLAHGSWYHLAIVRSGRTVQAYLNGATLGTRTYAFDQALEVATGGLWTGADQDKIGGGWATLDFLRGRLDEVRVWSVARTTEQIRANRSVPVHSQAAGLRAYWRFEEGAGIHSFDSVNGRVADLSASGEAVIFDYNPTPQWTTLAADASISGYVLEASENGYVLGGLAGAVVSVSDGPSTATDETGFFRFLSLPPGQATVTAAKDGFLPASRPVGVSPRSSVVQTFTLQPESGERPLVGDPFSNRGRHVIGGMPGNSVFEANIHWNGEPGTVRFLLAGSWHAAVLSTESDGRSIARVVVPEFGSIGSTGEWVVEAINGEGRKTTHLAGVFFYPVPDVIQQLIGYSGLLDWEARSTTRVSLEVTQAVTLWEVRAGVAKTSASYSGSTSVNFDTVAGTFQGASQLAGGIELDVDVSGVEVLGEGEVAAMGSLAVGLRGHEAPDLEGVLGLELSGRAGVGVPAVLLIDAMFPVASPLLATMRSAPVIGKVLTALKLRIYKTVAGTIEGHWANSVGDCWLGASAYSYSAVQGLEAHALVELGGAEVGMYIGGEGGPSLSLCPELDFEGVTLRGFIGVYAKYLLFSLTGEYSYEMTFEPSGREGQIRAAPLVEPEFRWKPLTEELSRHVASNWAFLHEKVPRIDRGDITTPAMNSLASRGLAGALFSHDKQ